MVGVLDGVRVLDYGRFIAAPWCSASARRHGRRRAAGGEARRRRRPLGAVRHRRRRGRHLPSVQPQQAVTDAGLHHAGGRGGHSSVGRAIGHRDRQHAVEGHAGQPLGLRQPSRDQTRHHPGQRHRLRRGWSLQRSDRLRRGGPGDVGGDVPARTSGHADPNGGAAGRLRHRADHDDRRDDGALSSPPDRRGAARGGCAAPDRADAVQRLPHRASPARRGQAENGQPRRLGGAVRPLRGDGRLGAASGGRPADVQALVSADRSRRA